MKKSVVKKILAFGMMFLMLAGSAAAKSKKSKKKDEAPKGVKVLKDPKTKKPYDLGGMEIIVADWWSPTTPGEPKNAHEEATLAYRNWIQKTYNFKIKQVGIDGWGQHPQTFANFATNGGDENYVFVMYQSSIAAPMKAGLFYDLATLKNLDFTQKKWVQTTKQLTTVGSHVYGMRAEEPEPKFGVYFNKRMLKEAGVDPESLYEMQKKGTWTWDAFEKICKKITRDTNNDGVNDVYAMTNFSVNYFNTILASDNACFIGRDKNGKYFNATTSNEFIEAMNWATDMINKYEMPTPKDAKWDYSFASFRNGEAAMEIAAVYESGNLKNMKDDYGFVCCPKGPKAKDYVNVWDDNVYVIPSCYSADRAEKIAFAFNLFSEPTPGYDGTDDWKTSYYTNFRDTRSVDETIAILKKNGVVWYSPLITGLNTGDIEYGVYGRSETPAEAIEKVKEPWQALIDEANGK
jgi:ABC-type glycerol-3-phosphate transport system substrate-binding protein